MGLLSGVRGLRVLGIVTARGGSKGVPRKNIVPLRGVPLLAYTAEAAAASSRLTRTVLSTDDEEIARVGVQCGLDVPFRRPAELARDTTPTLPVLQDVVSRLEEAGERYDAVCLLQPVCPLRTPEMIDGCIELLEETGCDSVVTMLPVPSDFNPHWVYVQGADGRMSLFTGEENPIPRRQELPAAFHREGSVYVTRRDVLMDGSLFGKNVRGFLVDPDNAVNIDVPEDLERAEKMLAAREAKSLAPTAVR